MKQNPETIVYNNNLYLFYHESEIITDVNNVKFSGMIMLYIDEIMNSDIVDLLFIISNLKKYNKPICLITTYNLEDIPKHINRYFDYIEHNTDILDLKENLSYLNIEGDLYIKGADY